MDTVWKLKKLKGVPVQESAYKCVQCCFCVSNVWATCQKTNSIPRSWEVLSWFLHSCWLEALEQEHYFSLTLHPRLHQNTLELKLYVDVQPLRCYCLETHAHDNLSCCIHRIFWGPSSDMHSAFCITSEVYVRFPSGTAVYFWWLHHIMKSFKPQPGPLGVLDALWGACVRFLWCCSKHCPKRLRLELFKGDSVFKMDTVVGS